MFIDIRQRHFISGSGPEPLVPRPHLDAPGITRAFDPRRAAWYTDTYLAGLPVRAGKGLDPDSLLHCLPQPENSVASRAKSLALGALTRLRSWPVLAALARTIPAHWQTRVKSWLRG